MNGVMSRASAEKGERDWGRMDGRDMDIGAQVLRIGTGEEEQSLHERERTSSLVIVNRRGRGGGATNTRGSE